MNIAKLNKAEVLAALFNASHQQGMGVMHARGRSGMTVEQAQAELDARPVGRKYFDYLHGRVMKIDLEEDELETRLYNRDNGPDAAEHALAPLLAKVQA